MMERKDTIQDWIFVALRYPLAAAEIPGKDVAACSLTLT
jgi:hypothetical protein